MSQRIQLPSGIDYGTGANGEWIVRGAMMGRSNTLPQDRTSPRKLHLEKLRFVDEAFDTGGAYWGYPANLYCAYAPDSDFKQEIMVFVRGNTRDEAKSRVRATLPGARFYR